MTLVVRNFGIATAYATVAVGEVKEEMRTARNAVAEFDGNGLSKPESIFLLGQADIATMVQTNNFSRIFDLAYPGSKSRATGVNWIFSAPLDLGRRREVRPPDASLRFLLHLRLRRAVYAYPEAEEKIVNKLTELLGKNRRGSRIHIGLGWTDLLIDGWFSASTFRDLIQFVINVHGVKLSFGNRDEDTIPILRRMLTVLGYVGKPPLFPGAGHLTFLRALPGKYNDVRNLLKPYGDVRILDGKADFLVISEPDSDAQWLREQKKLGEQSHRDRLRKVETHLMYFKADEFSNAVDSDDLNIDVGEENLHDGQCGCDISGAQMLLHIEAWRRRKTLSDIRRLIRDLTDRSLLPTEQRYAIDNSLFLLASTLRDSSICCDVRDAVMASYDGLLTILRRIDRVAKRRPPGSLGDEYKFIVAAWQYLDEWHRSTELLLRQRTVGSYEEILGQSDRAVVYSGGVQKFLYLADQLLIDFVKRVQRDDSSKFDGTIPLRFATIYDSVKTALSSRTGLVRVPTSNIFAFPKVVPDLWHEVASRLFFLRLAARLVPFAPEGQVNDFLAQIGDHYGDILVYLYGFGGDFDFFLASLTDVWDRTYDVRHHGQNSKQRPQLLSPPAVGQFLSRAYLIYEFHEMRTVRREQHYEKIRQFFIPETVAPRLIGELKEKLDEYGELFARANWTELAKNIKTRTFSNVHRKLYHPYLKIDVHISDPSLAPFERGEIMRMSGGDDLNDYFGKLASWLQNPRRADDIRPFQMEAALGESAAIEYHRRQMTRRGAAE